jgi:hypothetical protein
VPNYSVDEKKEIIEVLDACSKEMGISASMTDLSRMGEQLVPFYGPDLFRLLWQIPYSMKGFPSALRIIERLKKGPVEAPKNGVAPAPVIENKPEDQKARTNRAMEECLNALKIGKRPEEKEKPKIPLPPNAGDFPGGLSKVQLAAITKTEAIAEFEFEEEPAPAADPDFEFEVEPDFSFDI